MDTKKLLIDAEAFRQAALRSLSKDIKTMLLTPAAMNYSFSAELYLKYILIKEGKTKKGHNIKFLFHELSKESQEHIKKTINLPPFLFDKLLELNSNVFTEWRYLYEGNKGNLQVDFPFFRSLINGLISLSVKYQD